METTITLEGRTARCGCGKTKPSSKDLAFFRYKGEGSSPADLTCGFLIKGSICHAHPEVHQEINPSTKRAGITDHEHQPHGAFEFDEFYCGCSGWD